MDPTLLPALVLLGIVVLFVASLRDPPSFWRQLRRHIDQLGNELDRHVDHERWVRRLPVFSAKTVRAREAQYLRERLPRRAPRARYLMLLLLIGVLVWWLTH